MTTQNKNNQSQQDKTSTQDMSVSVVGDNYPLTADDKTADVEQDGDIKNQPSCSSNQENCEICKDYPKKYWCNPSNSNNNKTPSNVNGDEGSNPSEQSAMVARSLADLNLNNKELLKSTNNLEISSFIPNKESEMCICGHGKSYHHYGYGKCVFNDKSVGKSDKCSCTHFRPSSSRKVMGGEKLE